MPTTSVASHRLTAIRTKRALDNQGVVITPPPHLTQAQQVIFTQLISGRLAIDWSGPDILRLSRLARLYDLSEQALNLGDPLDPDCPYFERYVLLERLIIAVCRQLHMHQTPVVSTVGLAAISQDFESNKGAHDDHQLG